MNLRRGGRGSNQYQTKPGGSPIMEADHDLVAAAESLSDDDYGSEDIAAMFDPSRREWVQAGFPAEDIDAWEAHGFDIAGAVEASWAGLTPEGDGRRIRSPGDMWILRWTSAGFRGQELVDWLDEFNPGEAAAWRDRGYTVDEARIAARHGLFPGDLRREGRTRLPVTDERAERAKRRMVKRWEDVPAREWEACRQAGAYRPRDVAAWLRLGEGVSPHDHLEVWMKRGTPQNLARARKVRDGDISRGLLDCPELAEQTFSIMDANPVMGLPAAYSQACDGWRIRGSWSPETTARDWCREGITTPERMHEWLDAGIKDNRFAGAFTRLGITPQQCEPWAEMSAQDRIRIPAYLAAGYTPDTLPAGRDTRTV